MQGSSLHLGCEALLSESVVVTSPYNIHSYAGEATVHQPAAIPQVVIIYIIHSLHMMSLYKRGHAAFLITPTEVMLLSAMLSVYVHKSTIWMCTICTRASPSTDSILLPLKYRAVRTVKWMWAISFTIVALRFFPTFSITYIRRVPSHGIEWCRLPADSLLLSTAHLNKIVPT